MSGHLIEDQVDRELHINIRELMLGVVGERVGGSR